LQRHFATPYTAPSAKSQPPLLTPSPLFSEPPTDLEDAQRLSAEAENAVAALFHEGTSRNTARTYKTALHY
jgi:hypothetical protein